MKQITKMKTLPKNATKEERAKFYDFIQVPKNMELTFTEKELEERDSQTRKECYDEMREILKPEWEDPDIKGTVIKEVGEMAVYMPVIRNQFRIKLNQQLDEKEGK